MGKRITLVLHDRLAFVKNGHKTTMLETWCRRGELHGGAPSHPVYQVTRDVEEPAASLGTYLATDMTLGGHDVPCALDAKLAPTSR